MKKILISIIVLLALIGTAYAAEPIYAATVNVLDTPLGSGDTLTLYGFIDHTTGQGTLSMSSIKLRYYRVGADPEVSSTYINSGSMTYESNYENTDDLLLDGAYYAQLGISGLTDGTYTVQVLINDEVKDADSFTYNGNIDRNSTFTISSFYDIAGSLNVDYVATKENVATDVLFNVAFYSPTMSDTGIGGTDHTNSITVGNDNSSAASTNYNSPFVSGVNMFIAKVTGTNDTSSGIPLSYISLWTAGEQQSISSDGDITLSGDCYAKEETSKTCTFTATNTGDYPASYTVNAESDLTISTSFTSSLIQPGESATGTLTLTSVEGDAPSKTLTLKLVRGGSVLDTVSETITVQSRDLLHEVVIEDFEITPTDVREGDEITVSFKLTNTGDYDERVRIQYTIGSGETINYGNAFTLREGQTKSKSITFETPQGEEEINFELDVLKDEVSIAGRATTIFVEQLSFTPYLNWYNNYKNVPQGNHSENKLKVTNEGNTPGYYNVLIESNFASLNQDVYLQAGQSTDITVPIIVADNTPIGVKEVEATICSLTTGDCKSDEFKLTVIEKNTDNSTVITNQTLQELQGDEGSVFEIRVQNNEGATKSYSLSTGTFNGELQVSPGTLTIMDGEEGVFYLYAKPSEEETQSVTYQVLMDEDEVVSTGNLTMSYGTGLLTGLVTLSEAGSMGAIILGVALIAGLLILGVRSFNQSKVELKYWK